MSKYYNVEHFRISPTREQVAKTTALGVRMAFRIINKPSSVVPFSERTNGATFYDLLKGDINFKLMSQPFSPGTSELKTAFWNGVASVCNICALRRRSVTYFIASGVDRGPNRSVEQGSRSSEPAHQRLQEMA